MRWIEKVFHNLKLFLNVVLKHGKVINTVSVASQLHAEGSTGLAHTPEDAREPLRVQRDAIKKIIQYGEWIIKEKTKA